MSAVRSYCIVAWFDGIVRDGFLWRPFYRLLGNILFENLAYLFFDAGRNETACTSPKGHFGNRTSRGVRLLSSPVSSTVRACLAFSSKWGWHWNSWHNWVAVNWALISWNVKLHCKKEKKKKKKMTKLLISLWITKLKVKILKVFLKIVRFEHNAWLVAI